MGLIAPFWVGVGMGLIPLEAFSLPELTNLFSDYIHSSDLFVLLLSVGAAIFIAVILGLNNGIKLYAGNSRINALNMSISFIGVTCIIRIIIDFSNMMAYITTLYFTLAVQIANLCALWHFRHEWLVVTLPALTYIAFFITLLLT